MGIRNVFLLTAVLSAGVASAQTKRTERVEFPAMRATNEVVVVLNPGVDPLLFGYSHNLEPKRPFVSLPNAYVFETREADSRPRARLLSSAYGVAKVYANRKILRRKHGFTPNDPFFFNGAPNADWPGQWHLKNELTAGRDINVIPAWAKSYAGTSVVVGVLDDGVEVSHPDISPSNSGANAWDFVDNDANPSPGSDDDIHGTALAGLIAARGGNSVGVTGVAPFAKIAGLRLDLFDGTAQQFADATMFKSLGANPVIRVKNHSYGVADTCLDQTLERDALHLSSAAGTIHVFSAGNDRNTPLQDANRFMLLASPNAVVVGAMGSDGRYAAASNYGANLFCVAPSGSSNLLGLVTTDRVGETAGYNGSDVFPNADYTADMNGTSAAAALVSGVMALGVQVEPTLNTRLAKHILARTSTQIDTSNANWRTNAAGLKFNPNYGFGLVNAGSFTDLLEDYVGVSAVSTFDVESQTVAEPIQDFNQEGVERTFNVSATTPLEEVLVTLNCTHAFRGDLEVSLTSPQGTTARLLSATDDNHENLIWTLCANAFWGENPQGEWTLRVADRTEFDEGTWNSFSVQLRMGRPIGIDKVNALLVSPNSVFGGTAVTGRVDLFGPAREGGAVVSLRSSAGFADVPASVTVPSGAMNASFSISTDPVAATATSTITATRLGVSKTASLTVKVPIPNTVTVNPVSVQGGAAAAGTVTLNSPAPSGGLRVNLSSNTPGAEVPAFVTVPTGLLSVNFPIETNPVNANTAARLTATIGAASKPVILTVRPAAVSTITAAPTSLFGGESTAITINLTGPVPSAGGTVSISTNFPAIMEVPTVAEVPGGANTVTFTVPTNPVGATTRTQVYAVRGGVSKGVSVTVVRPSIESLTTVKTVLAGGETTVATVTLNAPAPTAGIPAAITTSDPVLLVPTSISVPNGQTSVTFNVGSQAVTSTKSSVLRATINGVAKGVSISVRVNTVNSLKFVPSTVRKQSVTNGTVQLSMPAGAGGNMVAMTTSHPTVLPVATSLFIGPGVPSRSFSVVAGNVTASTPVTVTAAFGGVTQTATVTVVP